MAHGVLGKSSIPETMATEKHPLILSLSRVDPLIQFWTKATGETTVSLSKLPLPWDDLNQLVDCGVLQVLGATPEEARVGFPKRDERKLHGSSKAAAKRRMKILEEHIKSEDRVVVENPEPGESRRVHEEAPDESPDENDTSHENDDTPEEARKAVYDLLGFSKEADPSSPVPQRVLPRQMSYAGSMPSQVPQHQSLSLSVLEQIPESVQHAFLKRPLYSHQARAIEAALNDRHTCICTGTGSGKSLAFLVPVLTAALKGRTSLVLFPTKALAQDQCTKLRESWPFVSTLDGDTPHAQRAAIATHAKVLLTNPDTLHAAILPNWKTIYEPLLSNLQYVVLDEAHVYQGVWGGHVSLVLRRLARLVNHPIRFLTASATLPWPEAHLRQLCPIQGEVTVVDEDGSPRAAKHFWVWNPPLLNMDGSTTGSVVPKRGKKRQVDGSESTVVEIVENDIVEATSVPLPRNKTQLYRRHAAEETALLLAKAISHGVRCIAFCKTRNLEHNF